MRGKRKTSDYSEDRKPLILTLQNADSPFKTYISELS